MPLLKIIMNIKVKNQILLNNDFFARDACIVAKELLGKVIYRKHQDIWLAAKITTTEAYYLDDKASHASLGYTEKRKALFMPPGTIYMYYARGGDSLNISVEGKGNAVLIKAAYPYLEDTYITIMQQLNPKKDGTRRPIESLCAGQTLLCKSLNIKVKDWDQQQFDIDEFFIADIDYKPKKIIETTRLGIPQGRDEHLLYRFIDNE